MKILFCFCLLSAASIAVAQPAPSKAQRKLASGTFTCYDALLTGLQGEMAKNISDACDVNKPFSFSQQFPDKNERRTSYLTFCCTAK